MNFAQKLHVGGGLNDKIAIVKTQYQAENYHLNSERVKRGRHGSPIKQVPDTMYR